MNGAQAVLKTLEDKGITEIYGYPGGAVLPLYDALLDSKKIKHILVRNEQAAAHAASGASRSSDKVGVCLATSGPGATNLVTGIATAYMDSIPLIAITGQVATSLIGTDAFQEVDITGITLPIVKHSYLVKSAEELPQIIEDAFHIANTGRKGPVLIDIPKDVQLQQIDYKEPEKTNLPGYKPNYKAHPKQIKRVIEAIDESKKPLFLIGGGLIYSDAIDAFHKMNDVLNIPIISTLMGISALATAADNFYGMIGLHGSPVANFAATDCDLLISLGARFDDRTTIVSKNFAKNAKIIHVDIDPAEIGKNIFTHIPIVCDIKNFIEGMTRQISEKEWTPWKEQLDQWRKERPLAYKKDGRLKPQLVLEHVSKCTEGKAFITTEVGQHQMWTAQFYQFDQHSHFITSGGLGTMGYGLPAAIGVKENNKDALVINVAGDGSFQMNFQEIATALEHGLDIKILLFNNSSLSLVRQLQYFSQNKRYSGIQFTCNPDFCKLVQAYPDTATYRVETPEELDSILEEALTNGKLTLIECIVSNEERVYPVANPALGIGHMKYLDDEDIRGDMF